MNGLKNIKTKQLLIIIAYLLFYILFIFALFLHNVDFDINIDNRYMLKSFDYSDATSLDTRVYLVDKTSPDVIAINGNIYKFQLYNDIIIGDISDENSIDFGKKSAPKGYFIFEKKSGKAILGLSEDKFMKILNRDYNINEMPRFEYGIRNYHKYFGLKPKDKK